MSAIGRRSGRIVVAAALLLAGWALAREVPSRVEGRVALFPLANFSGILVDAGPVEARLRRALSAAGLELVPSEGLEALFERHRVRHTAGVDRDLARALREEARVSAVLLTSLDLLDEGVTPRAALSARLITAEDDPAVLWMDFVDLVGDDRPGAFGLGVIREPDVLASNAVSELADGLRKYLEDPTRSGSTGRAARRHRPRTLWVSPDATRGRDPVRVAVVPFTNVTDRRQAGDLVQLLLVRALASEPEVRVLEPGVVRRFLLDRRIIPARGVSLAQADSFREALRVDWVVSGNVLGFEDGGGGGVPPARAAFSVTVLDARRREVVASAFSGAGGSDGLVLFGHGRIRTASGVAKELASSVVREILASSPRLKDDRSTTGR